MYNYQIPKAFEDFKEFILSNNIKSRSDFENKYPRGYFNFKKYLTKKEQDILLPLTVNDCSNINTFSDFKIFIKKNNIKSRKELLKKFPGCYKKFKDSLSEEEQKDLLPFLQREKCRLTSFREFKQFIKDNNIKTRKELKSKYPGYYIVFKKLFTDNDREKLLPLNINNYDNINTFNDFKNFIKENNIKSRYEFDKKFKACYLKFLKSLSNNERDELLPVIKKSFGEVFISKLLTEHRINFIVEKIYDDLSYKNPLRFDFFLIDLGILIEYHGPQHFDPTNEIYSKEGIERDKLKYEYAKQHNIPLLYFTNEVKIYEKYGYFTEVITEVDILIERINEIKTNNNKG